MKLNNKKIIKALSLGIVSLGLLVGISNVGSVNASSNVAGDISQQVLNQSIAETKAGEVQTERAEIESGIHMDKQHPKLAAYDALTEPHIFNKYIKPAISNYTNAQKKEFNDEYYADSGEYYFKDLNNSHKNHHTKRYNHKRVRKPSKTKHFKRANKHAKRLGRVNKRSHKHTRRTRKYSKKLSYKLRQQLRNDKKALKSRRARHSYRYRKSLNKVIKQIQTKLRAFK